MLKYCLISFMMLCLFNGIAQQKIDSNWDSFIDTNALRPSDVVDENVPVTALVIFEKKPKLQALASKRLTVLRILDANHLIVSAKQADLNAILNEVLTFSVNNLWKLSDISLLSHPGTQTYTIRASDPLRLKQLLLDNARTFFISEQYGDIFVVKATSIAVMNILLPQSFVSYIGKESFDVVAESSVNDLDLSFNNIRKVKNEFPDLDGSGMLVSVKDQLFDENDIDLEGKIVASAIASEDLNIHGTNMASIIAGSGNSSVTGLGVTPSAQVTSSDLTQVLPDDITIFENMGIIAQNHSYGTVLIDNFYGAQARAYDQHVYDNPTLVHTFSAGNSGEETPESGTYADVGMVANLTGNFKMAKNLLTVGAVNATGDALPFSSKGPAHDGRIKPELVAYSNVGTSNAAAMTTGVITMLQQEYQNTQSTAPSAALIKALLINGAQDVGNPGPDFSTGYGNIDAYESIQQLKNGQFIVDQITPAETKNYTITVPANAVQLKVSLVWTDPAAEVNTNIALVNDIDLRLVSPSNTTWLPWILDSSPNLSSITANATRGEDHLNNIEQVSLEDPVSGDYTIVLEGFDISTTSQEFALVYSWEVANQFSWDFPTASDNYPYDGETFSYLKWNSSLSENTGRIEVSYDGGTNWEVLSDGANLENEQFQWTPPLELNTLAQLKMVVGGQEFLSDSFTISHLPSIRTGLDCEDTIEINWNALPGIDTYEVYNYQNQVMTPIQQTVDTTYTFNRNAFTSNLFSVAPIFSDGSKGIRSVAVDYTLFEAGCYINSLFAMVPEAQNGVELFLSLGSLHDVAQIDFMRITPENSVTIGSLTDFDTLDITFLDETPMQGQNKYQVLVTLNDGRSYLSEIADIYFLTDQAFLVFPNPTTNEGINVYTKNFDGANVYFDLYSMEGRYLFRKTVNSDRAFISLNEVRPGIYIYRLSSSSGESESKKIVIR